MLSKDDLTALTIGAAIRIHQTIGPGLLESVYELLLAEELRRAGLSVVRQQSVNFVYNNIEFNNGFKVDLLIENRLIVEVKSMEVIKPVHKKQVLTYLRLMKLPVALLLNFGCETLKEGLTRIVNDLDPRESTLLVVNHVQS